VIAFTASEVCGDLLEPVCSIVRRVVLSREKSGVACSVVAVPWKHGTCGDSSRDEAWTRLALAVSRVPFFPLQVAPDA
jgi:hypothetical protein